MLSDLTQDCLLKLICETDARTHRTPKHFVRKPTSSACFISRQLLGCAGVLASLLRAWLSCHDHVAVAFAETSLIPERIKVEPVVRRQTRIMLQPRDVEIHPRLDLLGAMLPIQHDLVGEMFEVNIVAIPAPVETEE